MTTIGIDLGTSNSAAAVLRGGRPVIIPSSEGISLGGKALPSFVALAADGQTLVGEPVRRQATAKAQALKAALQQAGASIYAQAGAAPAAGATQADGPTGSATGTSAGRAAKVIDAQ